jgi:hypothetical protein
VKGSDLRRRAGRGTATASSPLEAPRSRLPSAFGGNRQPGRSRENASRRAATCRWIVWQMSARSRGAGLGWAWMESRRGVLPGRVLAVVGAVAVLVSLFLAWGGTGRANVLVLFGAVNRLGDFFKAPSANAWDAYPVAAVALMLLALLVLAAAFGHRAWVKLIALAGAVAGLAFVIDQISDPPQTSVKLPASLLRALPRDFAHHLRTGTSGAGETLAAIGVIAGVGGLIVTFLASSPSDNRTSDLGPSQ